MRRVDMVEPLAFDQLAIAHLIHIASSALHLILSDTVSPPPPNTECAPLNNPSTNGGRRVGLVATTDICRTTDIEKERRTDRCTFTWDTSMGTGASAMASKASWCTSLPTNTSKPLPCCFPRRHEPAKSLVVHIVVITDQYPLGIDRTFRLIHTLVRVVIRQQRALRGFRDVSHQKDGCTRSRECVQ